VRTLVAGWFSFKDGHATAGDLLSRDVACDWLNRSNVPFDVALAPPFQGGVDLLSVDSKLYSQVLFVCGPFQQGELEAQWLGRFAHCRLLGLNLSMELPLDQWNPFDFLIERDSTANANPDLVFLAPQRPVPVAGICLVEPYPGAMVDRANAAIQQLTASRNLSRVSIDTRLDVNSAGLRNSSEIESLIARMDVLITTRLHGMVLALKNGVPVIAIDPVAGGAKIQRQAQTIGWPVIFNVDTVNDQALRSALDYCLTDRARAEARQCAQHAVTCVETLRDRFVRTLLQPHELNHRFQARLASPAANSWIASRLPKNPAASTTASPEAEPRKSIAHRIARLWRGTRRD
jgi:hypothetical protein